MTTRIVCNDSRKDVEQHPADEHKLAFEDEDERL